jgi:hypothetical protein
VSAFFASAKTVSLAAQLCAGKRSPAAMTIATAQVPILAARPRRKIMTVFIWNDWANQAGMLMK